MRGKNVFKRVGLAVFIIALATCCFINLVFAQEDTDEKTFSAKSVRKSHRSTVKMVYPVDGLPGDTDCPSDETEAARQSNLPRSWYSVVWSGKYGGKWDTRCKETGGHPGVDIRVPSGTEVKAIGPGKVHKSYDNSSWGGLVVIKHENVSCVSGPVWSVYAHLKKRYVTEGQEIGYSGFPIGLSGGALSDPNHGKSDGAHLHFQIDRGNVFDTPYYPSNTETYDKNLTANTYDPLAFILCHTIVPPITIIPFESISRGKIKIEGEGFGDSYGKVELSVNIPKRLLFNQRITPAIAEWTDSTIQLENIFLDGFTFDKFDMPILIEIYDSTNAKVGELYYPFKDVENTDWEAPYVTKLWKDGVIEGINGCFCSSTEATRAEFLKMALVAKFGETPFDYVPQARPFPDVPTDQWYAPYADYAKEHGYIQGYKDGNFYPDETICRAEAVKILVKIFKLIQKGDSISWSDINPADPNAWYANPTNYLSIAASNTGCLNNYLADLSDFISARKIGEQIIEGYNDKEFKPEKKLCRAEAAKIIALASHLCWF